MSFVFEHWKKYRKKMQNNLQKILQKKILKNFSAFFSVNFFVFFSVFLYMDVAVMFISSIIGVNIIFKPIFLLKKRSEGRKVQSYFLTNENAFFCLPFRLTSFFFNLIGQKIWLDLSTFGSSDLFEWKIGFLPL